MVTGMSMGEEGGGEKVGDAVRYSYTSGGSRLADVAANADADAETWHAESELWGGMALEGGVVLTNGVGRGGGTRVWG